MATTPFMKTDILQQLSQDLCTNINAGHWIIHTQGRSPLRKDRFITIPMEGTPTSCCYIDSGNAPIWETPSQMAQLLRIAAVFFNHTKRTDFKQHTFCALAHSIDDSISIKSYGYPMEGLKFSPHDPNLCQGTKPATMAACLEVCRILAEIDIGMDTIPKLPEHGTLIIEGDLSRRHPIISTKMTHLYSTCQEKKISLIGVSKTTTAGTDTGISATYALHHLQPPGMWAYPLDSNDGMHRLFAKLHPASRHAFLISSPTALHDSTLSCLAKASTDPSFLGYPYGLIVADQLARVSTTEQETWRLILTTKAMARDPTLLTALSGSDAHDILDKMQY